MADMTLKTKSALGGYSKNFDTVTLAEVTGKALVSIATPDGNKKSLARALKKAFKADLPTIGTSARSGQSKAVFWAMQPGQLFVLFDHDGHDSVKYIEDKLGNTSYYTDQSDSWVILNMSGPGCRTALERIAMIDLHPKVFLVGSVARTVMEHLGTIIYLQSADSFLVLTARSFASSLVHALETSIHNTA